VPQVQEDHLGWVRVSCYIFSLDAACKSSAASSWIFGRFLSMRSCC